MNGNIVHMQGEVETLRKEIEDQKLLIIKRQDEHTKAMENLKSKHQEEIDYLQRTFQVILRYLLYFY